MIFTDNNDNNNNGNITYNKRIANKITLFLLIFDPNLYYNYEIFFFNYSITKIKTKKERNV